MSKLLVSLLKQPLLHFLLAAVLIFVVHGLRTEPADTRSPENASRKILIDSDTLLNYMQYRDSVFEPDSYQARLAAMTDEQRRQLTADYVREEALYREARAMGLEEGDYIIRQRLVQKVEYLLDSLLEVPDPSEEELQAYFAANREDYYQDAVYTFTHIFFDADKAGEEQARSRAELLLAQIPDPAQAEDGQYGDRFPFLRNYTQRSRSFVINNFDKEFVAALDQLDPEKPQWSEPLASRYGLHLVYLRDRIEGRYPQLQEVRSRVVSDWQYDSRMRLRAEAEQRVLSAYETVQAEP